MSLVKQNRISAKAVDATSNPYLNAQRTWNAHVGSVVASRTLWQFTAMIALLIVLVAVGGIIHIGSQSKFVPYVVEVDKLGQPMAVAPAAVAAKADPRIVRAQLAEFITNARLVTPDITLQRKAIFRVYSMLTQVSAASGKMDAFYNSSPELNPFKRAAHETVSVEIVSVLPQSDKSWQVEWIETVRARKNGQLLVKPFRMRAILSTAQRDSNGSLNEEQLRLNPLGIYVTDFSWSKQI